MPLSSLYYLDVYVWTFLKLQQKSFALLRHLDWGDFGALLGTNSPDSWLFDLKIKATE
jgi:hypothetical protein